MDQVPDRFDATPQQIADYRKVAGTGEIDTARVLRQENLLQEIDRVKRHMLYSPEEKIDALADVLKSIINKPL